MRGDEKPAMIVSSTIGLHLFHPPKDSILLDLDREQPTLSPAWLSGFVSLGLALNSKTLSA